MRLSTDSFPGVIAFTKSFFTPFRLYRSALVDLILADDGGCCCCCCFCCGGGSRGSEAEVVESGGNGDVEAECESNGVEGIVGGNGEGFGADGPEAEVVESVGKVWEEDADAVISVC